VSEKKSPASEALMTYIDALVEEVAQWRLWAIENAEWFIAKDDFGHTAKRSINSNVKLTNARMDTDRAAQDMRAVCESLPREGVPDGRS